MVVMVTATPLGDRTQETCSITVKNSIWCVFYEHFWCLFVFCREQKLKERKDYYDILGVAKDASQDEIKNGYHKAARRHHPGKERDETLKHWLAIWEGFNIQCASKEV